jgi:Arc/MetJ-type ribon-helix-helix transcriptional regulator
MTIHLRPEQKRRIQAVISRGAYESVEEVVEAALTAVEQRSVPELCRDTGRTGHLAGGRSRVKATRGRRVLGSVGKRTDAMIAEHKTRPAFVKALYRQFASDDVRCGSFAVVSLP